MSCPTTGASMVREEYDLECDGTRKTCHMVKELIRKVFDCEYPILPMATILEFQNSMIPKNNR
jgi:hypothetical protein